jgi:hypothetical protein
MFYYDIRVYSGNDNIIFFRPGSKIKEVHLHPDFVQERRYENFLINDIAIVTVNTYLKILNN